MKKYITIIIVGMTFSVLKAQETTPEDALRYAVENVTGSARYRGMGGAFGAVGGDLSALNQNPAGSLFFNNNYATVTASISNSKNSSSYNGTRTKDNDSSLDLNQAGVVFIFNDKGEILLHKRADKKYHSGGLWTNACCSHPQPGEEILAAAPRTV